MHRRNFIIQSGFLLGASGLLPAVAEAAPDDETLVILHTNDVHSRLDPFPMDGSRNEGMGGVAARQKLINDIRKEHKHVLLLDAGDIFQGTPYFNFFKGEPEIKMMTALGYDAGTMGNHDFDGGIDNFTRQLDYADFPIIISNYNFHNTSLYGHTKMYRTFKKGRLKVGVFGLGVKLQGLVPQSLYGSTVYEDPLGVSNEMAKHLKYTEKCDLVICLSHLGYEYGNPNIISDKILAAASENIDIIIGGHTHTFLSKPDVVINKKNEQVVINQVGWAGIYLGRLDISFSRVNKKEFMQSNNIAVEEKT